MDVQVIDAGVDGGHRYHTVLETADARTVSVWIPPGGTELSEEQEAALRDLVESTFELATTTATSDRATARSASSRRSWMPPS